MYNEKKDRYSVLSQKYWNSGKYHYLFWESDARKNNAVEIIQEREIAIKVSTV